MENGPHLPQTPHQENLPPLTGIERYLVPATIRGLSRTVGQKLIEEPFRTYGQEGETPVNFAERMYREGKRIQAEDTAFRHHIETPEARAAVVNRFARLVETMGGSMHDVQMPRELYDELLAHFTEHLFLSPRKATTWSEHNALHALSVMQSAWMAGEFTNLVDRTTNTSETFSQEDLLAIAVGGLIHDTQKRFDVLPSFHRGMLSRHMYRIGKEAQGIVTSDFSFLKARVGDERWDTFVKKVNEIVLRHGPETGEPDEEYQHLVEPVRFADENSLYRLLGSKHGISRIFGGSIIALRITPERYISKTALPQLTNNSNVHRAFIDTERLLDIYPTRLAKEHNDFSLDGQKTVFTHALEELGLLEPARAE